MFKEKFLIFDLPKAPGESKKGTEPLNEVQIAEVQVNAELANVSDQLAEDLGRTTADSILTEIFGAKIEEATFELGEKYEAIYQEIDKILGDGYQYRGPEIKGNDLSLLFTAKRHAKKISLSQLAGRKLNDYIEHLHDEQAGRQAEIYFASSIKPFLLEHYPHLKDRIDKTDLVRERILPVLIEGYKNGFPYHFYAMKGGFTLESMDKNEFSEPEYFNRYDNNLDYPKLRQKPQPKAEPEALARGKLETPAVARKLAIEFVKENMMKYLKAQRPKMKDEKSILASHLIALEVIPVLQNGYEAGLPYKFIETPPTGFKLKSGDDEQQYDMGDFGDYLSLKAPAKATASTGDKQKIDLPGEKALSDAPKSAMEVTSKERESLETARFEQSVKTKAQELFPEEFKAGQYTTDEENEPDLETRQALLGNLKAKAPKINDFIEYAENKLEDYLYQLELKSDTLLPYEIADFKNGILEEVSAHKKETMIKAFTNNDTELAAALSTAHDLFEQTLSQVDNPYWDIANKNQEAKDAAESDNKPKNTENRYLP